MPYKNILSKLLEEPWAIEESWLKKMYAVVTDRVDIQALETQLGKKLANTYVATQRGRTAILPITGPVFPRAGLFDKVSGATSLEMVAQDFVKAENNDDIDNIVIKADSPGGAVTFVDEFSAMVRDCKKPVYAHVSGAANSAMYWIISGAKEISLSPTSIMGSIGVYHAVHKEPPEGEKDIVEFVSSVSPRKRFNPESDEGRSAVMAVIDGIAEVFVADVAKGRNTNPEDVIQNYGKGGVLVGQAAVDAGMADNISTFEELMAKLSEQETTSYGENPMDVKELRAEHADTYDAVFAAGVSSAETDHESVITVMKADNKTLLDENTALKAAITKQKAIQEAKNIGAKADAVFTKVVAKSPIPQRLHTKVRACLDHNKFVAEGAFDADGFKKAVAAEVKEWSGSFEPAATTGDTDNGPLAGFGDAGDEGNTNNKKVRATVDAAVGSLLTHLN